jgi:hypothetical protein
MALDSQQKTQVMLLLVIIVLLVAWLVVDWRQYRRHRSS